MAGRYALIVANDRYDDPKLKRLRGPAKDAEALAQVLRDPAIGDFAVDVAMNEPEARLRRKVNRFFQDRARDDTLLLHFSGHGLKDAGGDLYFAAADTEVDHLEDSAVESDWVRRRMDASRSMKIVLLLDCCFSGAFGKGLRPRGDGAAHAMEALEGSGRVVLTASDAVQFSWEGDAPSGEPTPSVFTSALVRGLETGEADLDRDRLISIGELYDYVFSAVRDSGARQTPGMTGEIKGELVIARSRREPPSAPLPAELAEAAESSLPTTRRAVVIDLAPLVRKGGGL